MKTEPFDDFFDEEEEEEGFGSCELCGIELTEMPNPGWGVGYACDSCAKQIYYE
jgi:hypothetical protein